MRKSLIVGGVIVVGVVGVVALSWDSLVATFDEMAAMAGEVAVETGKELGRVSYHAVQCGDSAVMDEMRAAMDELDSTSDFQASMKDAFYQGIEDARGMDMEYTADYCAELQRQIEEAKN
jgi:hypothetical protein